MKALPIAAIALCLAACSPAQPGKAPEASSSVSPLTASVSVPTASATVLPAAFLGKWDAPPKPCGTSYRSDMQLDITATDLTFFESGGSVRSVKVNSPDDIVVDLDMSGEGEEWKKSLHMVLSDNGKTLTLDDGQMGTRVRCAS